MSFSGLKDIDREILKYVGDKELLLVCTVDQKTWNEVCDDNFLKRRLINKYPGIEKYKNGNESWKRFFLKFAYYTTLMREKYKFEYTGGNFETQHDLLKRYNKKKDSLLEYAADEGELSLVKYAIENGADIHYNVDGALSYASRYGHLDIVKWLVENGADVCAEANLPVGWASQEGHIDIVKYLVEKGADIHDNEGYSLREAATQGHLSIVKYLVGHGANINTDEEAALKGASREGHLSVVKYLVEHGADIHVTNEYAVMFAKKYGHTDVVKYLVEQGADIHKEEALRLAEERAHYEIVKLLN